MSTIMTACNVVVALALLLSIVTVTLGQPQRRGSVRLFRNGLTEPSYSFGRVQIYINGQWGNICDDFQFDFRAANVICHQLSYTGASTFSNVGSDSFGNDSLPILVDDVQCSTSDFLVVLQCSHNLTVDRDNCVNGVHDVSVTCFTTRIWDNPFTGMIRLQQGMYSSQGLVEMYCNGQWGTACIDTFNSVDANVVCRQLGYSGAAHHDNMPYQGSSSQPIWLDNAVCSSSSLTCIRSCQICPSVGSRVCSHGEDVSVECEVSSSSSSHPATKINTCNFDPATVASPTASGTSPVTGIIPNAFINLTGIIVGVTIGSLVLFCIIPILIAIICCICAGVGIGALCKKSSERRRETGVKVVSTTGYSYSYPPQPAPYIHQPPTAPPSNYPPPAAGYPPQPASYPAETAPPYPQQPAPYPAQPPYPSFTAPHSNLPPGFVDPIQRS